MERPEELPLLGFRRKKSKAVCHVPKKVRALCRDRASKRWSALLTLTKSRIGYKCGMRQRLGEAHWAEFVRYAEAEHKEAFFEALTPTLGVLCCERRLEGVACPKNVGIDLTSVSIAECGDELPKLHMDHTHDLKHICRVWSQALPEHPTSWDDGVCGPLVAHLLFGTNDHVLSQCSDRAVWRKQVVLRCGDVRGVQGQHAKDFCHDVAGAHYKYALCIEDIQWPTRSQNALP